MSAGCAFSAVCSCSSRHCAPSSRALCSHVEARWRHRHDVVDGSNLLRLGDAPPCRDTCRAPREHVQLVAHRLDARRQHRPGKVLERNGCTHATIVDQTSFFTPGVASRSSTRARRRRSQRCDLAKTGGRVGDARSSFWTGLGLRFGQGFILDTHTESEDSGSP